MSPLAEKGGKEKKVLQFA